MKPRRYNKICFSSNKINILSYARVNHAKGVTQTKLGANNMTKYEICLQNKVYCK